MSNHSELITYLKNSFSERTTLSENSFSILSSISRLGADPDLQEVFQEYVLRALDAKSCFEQYADLLNSITRRAGLYPYLEQSELSLRDQMAFEYHKPINLEDEFVFHAAQGEIYRRILEGENIALSAPTSYGKSLIIDAIIASGLFDNVVIVVPTIALIDETRRRLSRRFRDRFKVITHTSQGPANRNIFVLTQERVIEFDTLAQVDFFVIDEFYKLDPTRDDNERAALLNQAFYKLHKLSKRFYMLGPSIFGLPQEFQERVDCKFILDPYQTVISEVHDVSAGEEDVKTLIDLCKTFDDSTSIFCRSPKRASDIAKALIEAGIGKESARLKPAADWICYNYHPDWHFAHAIRQGIGVHHGRIPRSLAQFAVRQFNSGELKFMVCTSTLIEGVNTKARNMVILDNEINRNPIDFFTFNNIRGRSGRMMQHFIGHVYIFKSPPQYELPFVDVPAYTQSTDTPTSLLIQLDDEDLEPQAKERVKKYSEQDILSYEVLRKNSGIDPDIQLELAAEIHQRIEYYHKNLYWTNIPNYKQLEFMCFVIWNHFGGHRLGGGSVRTAKQLAFLVSKLSRKPSAKDLIIDKLKWEKDPDEAVQQTLDFLRLWATFHFPRLLRVVDIIQRDIFKRYELPTGNYESFGVLIENLFLDPAIIAIDEYGIPLEIARKIESVISEDGNLDKTLAKLKVLAVENLDLTDFEKEIIKDSVSCL